MREKLIILKYHSDFLANIPPICFILVNLFTRMIKTTSLAALIGVSDMLKVGQQIIEVNLISYPQASFWVYGGIFALYFMLCYPLSLFSQHLERKLA
ncbi:hypothetical protein BA916_07970 [Helicobacter pullorum]|nr:hypothetical protein BA916_07970 [Helicobacter pullorum]